MKKTLSIILAAAMVLGVLSVIPMTVFAGDPTTPAAQPIKTEAEFLAMDPAGNYYLDADLVLTKTYGLPEGEITTTNQPKAFTGTFDGNGKTATVSAPMFNVIDGGTVKNLKVAGEVTTGITIAKTDGYAYDDAGAGAVAAFAANGATFEAITSSANVNVPKVGDTNAAAGAIYGVGWGGVTVTDCVNTGNITGNDQVGGLVGWADRTKNSTFTIKNCINNGTVNMAGNYGGGIVGRASEGATIIENCTNNGAMSCYKSQFGGIVGYIEHALDVTITGCANNGAPADYNTTDTTYPNFGGIVGVTKATAVSVVTIKDCVNTATFDSGVKAKVYGGGIAARFTANKLAIVYNVENCLNTGKIAGCQTSGGIIAQISGGAAGTLITANIKNCVNLGEVYGDTSATSGTLRAAGIVGHTEYTGSNIYHCVNAANVTADPSYEVSARIGGMIGYQGGDTAAKDKSVTVISNCVNLGDMKAESTSVNSIVGGIAGGLYQISSIINCYSDADVVGAQAGGIYGYQYGSDDNGAWPVIKNSVAYGTVTAVKDNGVGAAVGYYNASKAEIQNNFFDVAVTALSGGAKVASVLGWNNKSANTADLVFNNYVPTGCTAAYGLTYNADGGDATQTPIILADAITAGFIKADTAENAMAAINTAAGTALYEIKDGKILPICDHNFPQLDVAEVPATCTEKGTTAGTKCSACGEIITGCEEIALIAHTFVDGKCTVCQADDPNYNAGETTPSEGGDETTPSEGGDETTPSEGGDETTPSEGGDETTPGTTTDEEGCAGCGGFSAFAALIAIISAAGVVIIKKKA